MSTLKKNLELTESFDQLVDLARGRLQTLTGTDGQSYLSFYTDKLLYSFGYNHPEISRDINQYIKDHQTTPVEVSALIEEIQSALTPKLPRRLSTLYFDGYDIYTPVLKNLTLNGRFRFLCLEKPDQIQSSYRKQLFTFHDLLYKNESLDQKPVIPDLNDLKILMKQYRSEIAGCIINPVLLGQGKILQEKELAPLLELFKKARIPLIWDDSHAGFFRLGPVFSYEDYGVEPDFLICSPGLCGNRSLHFVAVSKKYTRMMPEKTPSFQSDTLPNLIIFRGILNHLAQNRYTAATRSLGTRIQGKLRALEANCDQKFTVSGCGLTWFVDLLTPEMRTTFIKDMKDRGFLIKALATDSTSIILSPPLCVTEEAVDRMIEAMKKCFEALHTKA